MAAPVPAVRVNEAPSVPVMQFYEESAPARGAGSYNNYQQPYQPEPQVNTTGTVEPSSGIGVQELSPLSYNYTNDSNTYAYRQSAGEQYYSPSDGEYNTAADVTPTGEITFSPYDSTAPVTVADAAPLSQGETVSQVKLAAVVPQEAITFHPRDAIAATTMPTQPAPMRDHAPETWSGQPVSYNPAPAATAAAVAAGKPSSFNPVATLDSISKWVMNGFQNIASRSQEPAEIVQPETAQYQYTEQMQPAQPQEQVLRLPDSYKQQQVASVPVPVPAPRREEQVLRLPSLYKEPAYQQPATPYNPTVKNLADSTVHMAQAAPVVSVSSASIAPPPQQHVLKVPAEMMPQPQARLVGGTILQKQAPVPKSAPRQVISSQAAAFTWPVKGRVISHYGPQNGGMFNDGINIAAREGEPIVAADDGEVVYSGNELRGYGNMVILRHKNNVMTAYAHASRILVNKGEMISRGTPIALVGSTGGVDQPQVHFGIRKNKEPVDPVVFLGGNAVAMR